MDQNYDSRKKKCSEHHLVISGLEKQAEDVYCGSRQRFLPLEKDGMAKADIAWSWADGSSIEPWKIVGLEEWPIPLFFPFSLSCVFLCLLHSSLLANFLSHIGQGYGFSPV